MPLMLARTLSRKDTPSSVRTLSFDESPGLAPSAHIPADVVLPKVDTVQCYDGVLSFERASFPNLRSVAIELGPRSKMPEVLASYTKLGFVHLGKIHDEAALAFLEPFEVETLSITSGALKSLRGLERLRSLKRVYVKNLPKLADISSITALPKLTSITIQYCGALRDLKPLLRAGRFATSRS